MNQNVNEKLLNSEVAETRSTDTSDVLKEAEHEAAADVAFAKSHDFPKLAEFLEKYTLAIEVDFNDKDDINDGVPTMTANIVQRGGTASEVVASARKIALLKFGTEDEEGNDDRNDRPDALTFYGPDGNVVQSYTGNEASALDEAGSKALNAQMQEVWGVEADAPLMGKIGEAMAHTSAMVNAAGLLAQVTGASPGKVFTELTKVTMGDRIKMANRKADGSFTNAEGKQTEVFE